MPSTGRQSARAILIDGRGQLALLKRTKPGQRPYWTAPGGGVEDSDVSVEAALHRELAEELGATVAGASHVLDSDDGQHFFVARLVRLDESARSGPEHGDPSRGAYDLDWIDLHSNDLAAIDVKPAALKSFLLANRETLRTEAGGHRD
ncbi:NUDIX domain-containing protein [Amycolatopsis benzoatilytica]|uniref:NUDIX domain-containing protein n=1 Tax=Amycolatopsis benzoatilytica TaxID=346045 RepID=UPI0005570423|nr:NUDIX domain-containing protein [Amycolatopsis benzoatilytica]